MMTKKKILALGIATLLFVGCCVQGIREDIMKHSSEKTMVTEDLSYLILNEISVPDVSEVDLDECNLANETAIISQLVRGSSLSEQELQQCGQAITYVESRYLGITDAPVFKLMEDGTSYYSFDENMIYMSSDSITNWSDYIREAIHLTYHAYEKQQMEMYASIGDEYKKMKLFWDAKSWCKEQNKYSACDEKSYKSLWIERDAVEYARDSQAEYVSAVYDYWHYSDAYLNPDNPKDNEMSYILI